MNLLPSALADDDTHWHTNLNSRHVGIDDVCRNLRTFVQGDDRDYVGDSFGKIRVIRFIEDNKGTNSSPA